MKYSQSKHKLQFNKLKVLKRTIKFLSVATDLKVAKSVIQKAPIEVITAISNAELNGRQGAVHISSQLIHLCRHHIHHFDYLCDRIKSIPSK